MRKKLLVLRWPDIAEVFERRFNQQYCAVELFTRQGRSYFFNLFSAEQLADLKRALTSVHYSGKVYMNLSFHAERALLDWKEGRLSNFDYLMTINRFASRSFNDLNQYPVFPWVIGDYESKELNLGLSASFRDLSKPIGAIVPEAREEAERRYQQFAGDTDLRPHHFGSHYSMSGSVVYFLLRLEPYTSQAILLQDGQFDVADRVFGSIANAYLSSTRTSGDYKELTPEMCYLPELLLNINQLPLGRCQADHSVNHVELPPWAGDSPYRFVALCRAALEAPKVSEMLNCWIDLIFGYQQTGEAAKSALNVFLDSTYEANAREILQIAKTDSKLTGLLDQILLYGQTPVQLLQARHPKRVPESCKQGTERPADLLVQVTHFPLKPVAAFLLKSGVLIVTEDWKVGWGKITSTPKQYKEKHFRCPEGVHPSTVLSQASCLLLHSYLVTCLHPDNSFKIHSLDKFQLLVSISFHIDTVCCMAVDSDYVLVGSQDTTLSLWRFPIDLEERLSSPLVWHLRGHQQGVKQCAVQWKLQVAVSMGLVRTT